MIKSKKMAGRAVLLAGPPGTGKVGQLTINLMDIYNIIYMYIYVYIYIYIY